MTRATLRQGNPEGASRVHACVENPGSGGSRRAQRPDTARHAVTDGRATPSSGARGTRARRTAGPVVRAEDLVAATVALPPSVPAPTPAPTPAPPSAPVSSWGDDGPRARPAGADRPRTPTGDAARAAAPWPRTGAPRIAPARRTGGRTGQDEQVPTARIPVPQRPRARRRSEQRPAARDLSAPAPAPARVPPPVSRTPDPLPPAERLPATPTSRAPRTPGVAAVGPRPPAPRTPAPGAGTAPAASSAARAARRRSRARSTGPDRAVTGLRRRIAHGAGAMALVVVAAAGLAWTVLVPPDGSAATADPATSALDNQLPPPPPPPPPQQWRQVGADEFDGTRVDRSVWSVYNSPGGFGNGLRRPSAVDVGDGLLTVTARPRAAGGGVSGGVAMHDGQLYGRWEFRARTDAGTGYSPAILLWPDSERFPDDGELDMMEIPFADRHAATAFVHYGAQNHILSTETPGDFTQWHTFALDWLPDRITWYVDGEKKWEVTDRRAIPTTPMHMAIQLDQGPAAKWIPGPDATTPDEVRLQVDWARVSEPVGDAG